MLNQTGDRLTEDHANARRLARGLAGIDGIALDVDAVATNIVRLRLTTLPASTFVESCHAAGVYMLPTGRDGVRAVTHLGVSDADVDTAVDVVAAVMAENTARVAS